VSRASEKQRRGRAGRCQPGVAFHCYSRTRSQALAELQLPELKRSPLDELCLQVCLPHLPHKFVLLHPSLLVFFMINATPEASRAYLQSKKRVQCKTLMKSRPSLMYVLTCPPTVLILNSIGFVPSKVHACSLAPTNQPDAAHPFHGTLSHNSASTCLFDHLHSHLLACMA